VNSSQRRRWLRLLVLVLCSGSIFKLANLKDAFYVPMQQFMQLSNTEIGVLLSVNATVSTLLFVLGGYLADRFPVRGPITLGLLGAGLAGIYMSTLPPFSHLLVIFGFLSFCADCLCWPALLKAIRHSGEGAEQGRLFGFFEGGRGLADTLVASLALGLFVWLGSGEQGFRAAILLFSMIDIAIGALSFLVLREPDDPSGPHVEGQQTLRGRAALRSALTMPAVWLVSLNVFMVYVVYCGLIFFVPYLRDVYGMSVGMVGVYGIVNQYALKILGGPLGGFLADRYFGGATAFLRVAFVLLVPAMLLVLLLPQGPQLVAVGIMATLGFSLVVFSMRGVFWAPMQEARVPAAISGTAFGIGCLIGYSPGMFAYAAYGAILDRLPGAAGYRVVFAIMLALSVLGFGVASRLAQAVRRAQ
jgi:sugar phosphate permease